MHGVLDLAERLGSALGSRYAIERQIGEGAMGNVFLATDLRHDRRVAIKVMRPEVAEHVGAERFLREIHIAAKLDHPHILMLIDSGDADGLLHYVMPFVDGESLRDRLAREGQLPIGDAVRIAGQVADALDYAHRRGIVHRDIKPENILLADGYAKVADFGIARSSNAVGTRLTTAGMWLGTPAYMSPEQFLGDDLDGRSDLYSLGCVLYEMLAGAPPFGGLPMQAIMSKRITQDADRVSTLRANVPRMVDLVLARALSRDAGDRHASTGEFAAALLAELSGASAEMMSATDGAVGPARRTPLVGRVRELDEARTMLADAARSSGGLLLVGGEPGVGKTRLCEAIIDEARARGMLCLTGHCYEMEGMPPYTPYAELLDVVARLVPPVAFRAALGDAAPEIARLQPSLRQTFPDLPPTLDLPPDRQRQHLHLKYREFIERAARVSPIVILLEDLHWADDASLALLEHSATYLSSVPIVTIGTYRDMDLDVNRGFARLLESLTRQRLARRLAVKPLPADAVSQLLGVLGGAAPPASLARLIFDETDGNPFFVEEVFAHLKEEGRIFDAGGHWRTDLRAEDLDVPEGVRLVIGRRLERLSETCRAVLTSAAVIGPRFGLRVLEQLADTNEDDLLDCLDAASAARLIAEQRGGREVTYAFAHELIRQTLLGGLSLPRRQRRHVKVATAIEQALGDRIASRASDLAYHLYQAGAAADADKTVQYLTLAAEQAYASAAYTEALTHCERGATIEEVTDKRLKAHLTNARGKALQGLARWPEALAAFGETLDFAIAAADADLVASSAFELAMFLSWAGQNAMALAVVEKAYAHLPETHVQGRARLMARIAGDWAMSKFDDAGGRERFAQAAAIAARVDDPILVAGMRVAETNCTMSFARFDDAAALATLACAALGEPVHRQLYLEAAGFKVLANHYAGSWLELLAERPALARMAQEGGNVGALFMLDSYGRSMDGSREGDWAVLERVGQEAPEKWGPIGHWAFMVESVGATAQLARGDVDGALATFGRARAQFPLNIWSGFIEMGEIVAATFDSDDAWTTRAESFAHLVPQVEPVPSAGSACYGLGLAVALNMRGEHEPLAALYPALHAILGRGYRVNYIWLVEGVVGLAAAASDEWAVAEQHFARALALGESIQHRFALPHVRQWYAEMLLRRKGPGDRARAEALLAQAISEFRALGMPLMVERAVAVL